jgi:hypothetical protein
MAVPSEASSDARAAWAGSEHRQEFRGDALANGSGSEIPARPVAETRTLGRGPAARAEFDHRIGEKKCNAALR